MSAGRICNRSVIIASLQESVREAARRMVTHNVGSLVVLDEDGRPTGILTDRDIMARCVAADLDPDVQLVGILALDDVLELLIEESGAIGRLLSRHQPTIP